VNEAASDRSRRLHHVGVVVADLELSVRRFRAAFDLEIVASATLPDQAVKAAILGLANAGLELIQPLDAESGVGRFLERRGEGLHHVCFTSLNLEVEIAALAAAGVELIDRAPREGLVGRICFLHPRALAGVLVELVEEASATRP